MASCLPLQPILKCFPVLAIAVFLIFFSGLKKNTFLGQRLKTAKRGHLVWQDEIQAQFGPHPRKSLVWLAISNGLLCINTMKSKRLLHLHPYKTLVVHKFYHSEHEAKIISWTANFRNFILEKSTTYLVCLAIFMSH